MAPRRKRGQRRYPGHSAQNVGAAAVDVGHVAVVTGVGPQAGEGELDEVVFLGVGRKWIVFPFFANGRRNLTAARASR